MALTQSQIEKKLSNEHLDELLELWQTEQGAMPGSSQAGDCLLYIYTKLVLVH